jgi:hypothetical protein
MCERQPEAKTEALAASALSLNTKCDNCAGHEPVTVRERSLTSIRNRRSRSVGAASRYPVSRATSDQKAPPDRWRRHPPRALETASRLTTPSCSKAGKRRNRIAGNSGWSALTSTPIILRSRSSASSLGATHFFEAINPILGTQKFGAGLEMRPQLLRGQPQVFQQDRRIVGTEGLAAQANVEQPVVAGSGSCLAL